jgi:hypothetical protein
MVGGYPDKMLKGIRILKASAIFVFRVPTDPSKSTSIESVVPDEFFTRRLTDILTITVVDDSWIETVLGLSRIYCMRRNYKLYDVGNGQHSIHIGGVRGRTCGG